MSFVWCAHVSLRVCSNMSIDDGSSVLLAKVLMKHAHAPDDMRGFHSPCSTCSTPRECYELVRLELVRLVHEYLTPVRGIPLRVVSALEFL